jgi:type IV secretion system protein VirB4
MYYTRGQERTGQWTRWLYENVPPPAEEGTTATVEYFREECARMVGLLQGCFPEVVLLEGEELLSYLKSTISTTQQRVRMPNPAIHLDTYLTDRDVQLGIQDVRVGDVTLRCISPRGTVGHPAYPEAVYPGILDPLLQLPMEFRAVLRYLPMDRPGAVREIQKRGKRWYGKGSAKQPTGVDLAALDNFHGAQDAQANVQHGRVSYGELTMTVVVWDAARPALERKVAMAEQALNDAGFVAKVETLDTMAAWMGSIPGNLWANPRRAPVSSDNLARLFPATTPSQGPPWNTHLKGPPALVARGKGSMPVRVSLHQGQVGHTGVIGSTGDGKSTLLNLLCVQHRRYPGQEIVIFDKHYAARHLTAAVGGAWHDLGVMSLQPLANLDQPYEIAWALDWLDGVYEQERLPLTPAQKEELAGGLAKVAEYDAVKRTLTTLGEVLETPALKYVLRRFPQLDGETDPMADNPWLCFEMATLLETPRVLNAVLPALFHRLEQRLTGVPTMYVMHEGWIALNTPYWRTRLVAWLKGLRTRNGWVVLATQSLADAVTSAIMPALLDNIATWICTPNTKALTDDIGKYYTAIGLNERHREMLALGTKQRQYLVYQATGSSLVELELGPVGLALCATPMEEELPQVEALIAQHGANFGAAWLHEKGIVCEIQGP